MKNIPKLLNAVHRERVGFLSKYGYGVGLKLHIYVSREFEKLCLEDWHFARPNPDIFNAEDRTVFGEFPYHVVVSDNHPDFLVFSEKPEEARHPDPNPTDGDKPYAE